MACPGSVLLPFLHAQPCKCSTNTRDVGSHHTYSQNLCGPFPRWLHTLGTQAHATAFGRMPSCCISLKEENDLTYLCIYCNQCTPRGNISGIEHLLYLWDNTAFGIHVRKSTVQHTVFLQQDVACNLVMDFFPLVNCFDCGIRPRWLHTLSAQAHINTFGRMPSHCISSKQSSSLTCLCICCNQCTPRGKRILIHLEGCLHTVSLQSNQVLWLACAYAAISVL